jgi:tripartite-type tricarboxylate transporter receptor subunit TctC
MIRSRPWQLTAGLILASAASALSTPATAQSVAEFYAGKSVNVLIGFSAGGGYDIYARTLARFMGRYIPGNPRLLPQNMPGAGSLRAVNFLYSVAPKDGTSIGHFAPGVMFEPLLGRPSAELGQFEATKFTWLGSVSKEVSVCAFMASTGIKSWEDMQSKKYIIAASGGGAESDVFPTVLRNMFNLPLKLVTGYPGGTEMVLAMERHEADGRCGWSWTSLLSRSKALLDNKQINLTLQIALQKDKHPALANVPLIVDLADDPAKKAALKLIVSRQAAARPFAAPPGVPADRARALREAFDATMKDPEFLAEAQKLNLDVDPVTGAEVEALIREVYASPPEAVKLASESMRELKD